MYVKEIEGQVRVFRSVEDIKPMYPNTSFPALSVESFLEYLGFLPLNLTTPPQEDFFTGVREIDPVLLSEGWVQRWEAYSLTHTTEEIEAEASRILQEKKDAAQIEKVRIRDGGVEFGGVLWDSDEQAQAAYQRFFTKLSFDPTAVVPNWRANKSTKVEMSAGLFVQLMGAWELHESKCFQWQDSVDAELDTAYNAKDIQALLAISTEYREVK